MNAPNPNLNRRHFVKKSALSACATVLASQHEPLALAVAEDGLDSRAKQRVAWWQEARFGMFIHWGLYSILGRGEWAMYQEHIPFDEYAPLADRFDPQDYDPAEWVSLARDAGMKYMVLTTRHHDGFCLFDSNVSDFTAPKTAARRDLIGEYVEACRKADMRIGLYYSLLDWHFPGTQPHQPVQPDEVYQPSVEQTHAQVRELCTNYGKIDILWYDMMIPHNAELWRARELNEMVRSLQPDILINNRAGEPADFGTPENSIRAEQRPWEACYSFNRSWGYAPYDTNYKSTNEILRLLATCVDGGGNLLLNVSPDASGKIPDNLQERLKTIGAWMKVHGKAIYGAGPSPIMTPGLGLNSRVGDKVYIFAQRWPGSPVPFAWCGSKVTSAILLSTGQKARIEQKGDRVWLHGLPVTPPDPYLPVIELTFDGPPKPSDPAYA